METVKKCIKALGKGFFNNFFERSIRVYIQKHLGEFLLHKLSPDQVDLGLDGGSLGDLYLNTEAINERLEGFNVPFTLLEGYINVLHLRIPWTEISTESIQVEVEGLMLTIKVKDEELLDDGIDVKSMFESMTASMVEECMKGDIAAADIEKLSSAGKEESPIESIELLSEFISSITNRIQVTLSNVLIVVEKCPGIKTELTIECLEFYDKDSHLSVSGVDPNIQEGITTKIVKLTNVRVSVEEIWTDESPPHQMDAAQQSTVAFQVAMSSPPTSGNYMTMSSSLTQSIYPGMSSDDFDANFDSSETSETHESSWKIPVLHMANTQTVSIQMKNNEQLSGPTVNVGWTMDNLHVFLSPRLITLVNRLFTKKSSRGPSSCQVPMTNEDFELCRRTMEEDIGHQHELLDKLTIPPLQTQQHMDIMGGISTDSILSQDDMFYSTYPTHAKGSVVEGYETASTSASSSTASAYSHAKRYREHSVSHHLEEAACETYQVSVTLPFFSLTVLMEDPQLCTLGPHSSHVHFHGAGSCSKSFSSQSPQRSVEKDKMPSSGSVQNDSVPSVQDLGSSKSSSFMSDNNGIKDRMCQNLELGLKEIAEKFLDATASLEPKQALQNLRDEMSRFLPYDHLGFLAKPVYIDVIRERKSRELHTEVKARFGKMEVIECLFDRLSSTNSEFSTQTLHKLPQYATLLSFDVNGELERPAQFDPRQVFDSPSHKVVQSALTLSLHTSQQNTSYKRKENPAVKLSLDFGKLTSEIDVTIVDRLTALTSALDTHGTQNTQLVEDYEHLEEESSSQVNMNVQIRADHATLKVRFPIPDLRVNPPPPTWCRRSLHKEILLLELEAPEVRSELQPGQGQTELELQVFKISAYLQEDINKDPVLFGEVTVEDTKATAYDKQHLNWPRVVIKFSNQSSSELEPEVYSDHSGASLEQFTDLMKKDSGPFSRRKSFYEKDDLSFTDQQVPVSEEMVMPGEAHELKQFREECLSQTWMSVDVFVPYLVALLPNKDFLELIYNRFNNDLLMWEPKPAQNRAYNASLAPSSASLGVLHLLQHLPDMVNASDTDSSDEDEDPSSMQYSIHGDGTSLGGKAKRQTSVKAHNKMCLTLFVGAGRVLTVGPHVADHTDPHLHSELLLTVKDTLLFSVNEYAGDPELKYLCLQTHRVQLYHNCHSVSVVQPGNLDPIRDGIPSCLKPRIIRTERGVSAKSQGLAGWSTDNSPDMLSLVVKTKMDSINNVKNFILALRIDGATLRHEQNYSGESWISQAMDLLDLKDFPIEGYNMPKIMTEIHVQMDNCGVDYRPTQLPIWSFLTVDHFSVCTNIIAESLASQIQLTLEDSALYLSTKCNKAINLLRDYVCVAEMDQLKICLQFNYGKHKQAKSDLRFMCNHLQLMTCADSAKALVDLISHVVTDGDLAQPENEDGNESAIAKDEAEEGGVEVPSQTVAPITPEQEASVKSAIEDAMEDTPDLQRKLRPGEGTQVFFKYNPTEHQDGDHLCSDALHITVQDDTSSQEDEPEDFEIVDCHFKKDTNPVLHGTHEVHLLSKEPVHIEDNFLPKPSSVFDHMRAPTGFPDPEYQYTLRELSVVWRMYGGSDFAAGRRTSSSAERHNVTKSINSPRSQRKTSSDNDSSVRHAWRHRGGEMRDLDVMMELDLNKIRFRYEVYPTNTAESSRFKLLVNAIEVRDLICASDVNKFLVKLVDKDHPEQSSVYMLMFTGVFKRPEHLPFREECEVKAFCLPLKLNIDQLALNFLRKFITQLTEGESEVIGDISGGRSSPSGGRASPLNGRGSPHSSVSSCDPIMRVGETSTKETKETSMDEKDLLMQFDKYSMQQSKYLQQCLDECDTATENLPVFIKSFVLVSDVTIKVDYRGKRCDMDQGVMGMMLGVASLTGSVVTMKRISCHKGILGWDKLLMYVANEWLKDIRTNQIHSILKGVGHLSIVVQIVQGMMDLVRLPIQQYQKDRRIIRGLQRGANSFTLNTLMAILELTNKVVGSIQYCAELGYDMMSPGPSVRRRKVQRHRNRQPRTTVEGAKAALELVTEGVKESASSLSAMVSEERSHKGVVGAVGSTLRNATPECIIKPLALLAEAGSSLVQGVRNEVDPSVMKEEEDRWKQA